MLRLAGLVEEHAGELAVTEAVNSGKPLAAARRPGTASPWT
jgi:hypothetical protein